MNGVKVGHNDPKCWIFEGFREISVLNPFMGLSISGIIINTQVMFLNALVTSPEENFDMLWQIWLVYACSAKTLTVSSNTILSPAAKWFVDTFFIRTVTVSRNTTLSPAPKLAHLEAVT